MRGLRIEALWVLPPAYDKADERIRLMQSEVDRQPATVKKKREINWVAVGVIVFAIAVAALSAWTDTIGGGESASPTPAATATVTHIGPPAAP
jgi:hypothetical protein